MSFNKEKVVEPMRAEGTGSQVSTETIIVAKCFWYFECNIVEEARH
jgi:hypothetical protein